MIKEVKEFKV